MDGLKTSFIVGRPVFRCYVSFREGIIYHQLSGPVDFYLTSVSCRFSPSAFWQSTFQQSWPRWDSSNFHLGHLLETKYACSAKTCSSSQCIQIHTEVWNSKVDSKNCTCKHMYCIYESKTPQHGFELKGCQVPNSFCFRKNKQKSKANSFSELPIKRVGNWI